MTISPMSLGDLFDRWFKLIGKTWLRSLILSLIILGPASLIFAVCMDSAFGRIAAMIDFDARDLESMDFAPLIELVVWFVIGLKLFILGTIATTVAITGVSCAEMTGKPFSWQDALRSAFAMPFWRVIGQYILLGFGFGILIGIPYALIIAGIASESVGLGLFGGFLLMVLIPGVIYLSVNFAFIIPATVAEDETIIGAFRRSWNLVRGHWWRTLGILILMSIAVSFAISVVMTPLYLIVMWDFFQAYFDMLGSLGSGEPDPAFAREMISSLGFAFGIVNAISSIAQMIVTPLYTVVLYFDLRARKGEFSQPSTPAPAPVR
jgi:hypothetical protein